MGIQAKRIYNDPTRPTGEQILVSSNGTSRLVYAVRNIEHNDAREPAEASRDRRRASSRRDRS